MKPGNLCVYTLRHGTCGFRVDGTLAPTPVQPYSTQIKPNQAFPDRQQPILCPSDYQPPAPTRGICLWQMPLLRAAFSVDITGLRLLAIGHKLMGSPGTRHFRRFWPVAAVLLAGLTASCGLGWRFHERSVEVDRARFRSLTNAVMEALDTRVEKVETILRQFQDYLSPQPALTAPVFGAWVWKRDIHDSVPWCCGLGFYTNENAGQWRKSLPSNTAAWGAQDLALFRNLAYKTPIILSKSFSVPNSPYVWPKITFQTWQGCPARTSDIHASDVRWSAAANRVLTTSWQSFRPQGSNPPCGASLVVSVLEADNEALENSQPLRSRDFKDEFFWNLCRGVIIAPIDYVKLEADIWSDIPKEVGVEIYASFVPRREKWLNPKAEGSHALDLRFDPYFCDTVLWKMYGSRWAVFIYTTPLFEEASPQRMVVLTMAEGMGMTLLASALVGVALRARSRQVAMTAEITEARDALTAAEKEREKLGHDLHDGAIQSLYAIQLKLGRAAERLKPGSAGVPAGACLSDNLPVPSMSGALPGVAGELSTARDELDSVIAEIRRFIHTQEAAEEPIELAAVLKVIARQTSVGEGAQIETHCEPEASKRLSPVQAVQAANIAREALSNAARHAKARQIKITLTSTDGSVWLEVADDGLGFDPNGVARRGIGLKSMRNRAAELGGRLEIDSGPGRGTRVRVQFPVSPQPVGADVRRL
jgi:signal transduction histidine kinase